MAFQSRGQLSDNNEAALVFALSADAAERLNREPAIAWNDHECCYQGGYGQGRVV